MTQQKHELAWPEETEGRKSRQPLDTSREGLCETGAPAVYLAMPFRDS